jgi:glycosyltransferase involved in cell wall biosynthesis
LHLGTLEPRKNLVRLVQAFGRARDSLRYEDNTRLVLAGGKGWDYEPIFQEVSRLNLEAYVVFPGYVPENELLWWYRAAAAFVYPSLWEGFGLPVLEAMACGTPTVTSKASSLPEVAGDGALLVDPLSVEELAEALIRVLGSEETAQRLRQAGMKQASRFSWQQTGQQTAAVYRRALN